MKASKMLISTLKEAPNEAAIPSHIYLLRAGMIKQLVSGVYNYLPMGLRVLHKIENIIRDEMDKSGSLEILSSALQPKELWEKSGRWFKYGPELVRLKDRHEREFCLGPTHEEVFTDLARTEIKSYKNLPLNIYQIQTKYRDEMRPRFGLMRSREFLMKDAYSFDKDEQGLDISYQNMYKTYENIFNRLNIKYKAVLADTGAIGGSGSHQFMAISDVGESTIIYCDHCHYAADEEKAESVIQEYNINENEKALEKVETPNKKTIEEVSEFLKITAKDLVKTMIYVAQGKYVAVLLRGDRFVNEIKLCNALNVAEFELRLASDAEIAELGSAAGFVGPVGLDLPIYIDKEIVNQKNFVVGANEKNYHLRNVNFHRDFNATVCDIRTAMENDICIKCGKPLKKEKGIEVGQVFKLGTKYSASMGCTYLNEKGQNIPMVMGCYGIGVSRTMQSIIDQNHDDNGIIWPINVAPYHVVVVPVDYNNETIKHIADSIYSQLLNNGLEVILDDRDAKPGFKFKDWDLIGIPYMIVVGKRAIEGIVELKNRRTGEKVDLDVNQATTSVTEQINKNK